MSLNMNPTQPTQRRRIQRNPMDKSAVGLLAGLLFGILGLVVVYFIMFRNKGDFGSYVNLFTAGNLSYGLAAKSISLAMICNLIPFYYFLNRKFYQGTKGVIMATGLLGVLFILYKFVL